MNTSPIRISKLIARLAVLGAATGCAVLSIAAIASAGPHPSAPACAPPKIPDSAGLFCIDPSALGIAPTDAVAVDVHQSPPSVTIDVKNSSALDGNCTYNANPTNNPLLPTVHRDFRLAPNGSHTLDFLAPPPGATYHLVISCRGDFRGTSIEFGHVERDVTGNL